MKQKWKQCLYLWRPWRLKLRLDKTKKIWRQSGLVFVFVICDAYSFAFFEQQSTLRWPLFHISNHIIWKKKKKKKKEKIIPFTNSYKKSASLPVIFGSFDPSAKNWTIKFDRTRNVKRDPFFFFSFFFYSLILIFFVINPVQHRYSPLLNLSTSFSVVSLTPNSWKSISLHLFNKRLGFFLNICRLYQGLRFHSQRKDGTNPTSVRHT